MRNVLRSIAVAGALVATAATAQPCMSDLDEEVYASRGECEAALARKRNEIRDYYALHPSGGFNGAIREWLHCTREGDFWVVRER